MTNNPDNASIFNVYSQRSHSGDGEGTPLTSKFKVRLLKWSVDTFDDDNFWNAIRNALIYVCGQAIPIPRTEVPMDQRIRSAVGNFLLSSKDADWFDFIETVCKSEAVLPRRASLGRSSDTGKNFVGAVNKFFELDNLPYLLTEFELASPERPDIRPIRQGLNDVPTVRAYPRIIRRDSEILHQEAIGPVVTLLREPDFRLANTEFLNALQDYRRGEYDDCVAKCGSAYESVMKIICKRRGWPMQNDAAKLLGTIMIQTGLSQFLKQPLLQTAIIRNQLGSAHGAGTEPRTVSKSLAHYTINVTAAAILLLVEEASE